MYATRIRHAGEPRRFRRGPAVENVKEAEELARELGPEQIVDIILSGVIVGRFTVDADTGDVVEIKVK